MVPTEVLGLVVPEMQSDEELIMVGVIFANVFVLLS
jgi:hypothetical protein